MTCTCDTPEALARVVGSRQPRAGRGVRTLSSLVRYALTAPSRLHRYREMHTRSLERLLAAYDGDRHE